MSAIDFYLDVGATTGSCVGVLGFVLCCWSAYTRGLHIQLQHYTNVTIQRAPCNLLCINSGLFVCACVTLTRRVMVAGKQGEKRVVITFNGKFLPFIEQKAEVRCHTPGS